MINPNFPDNEYDNYPGEEWNTTQEVDRILEKAITKPSSPFSEPGQLEWFKEYRRPINEIVADLSKEIPSKYLKQLTSSKGGGNYLPWHTCCILLDRCAPGWQYSITQVNFSSDRIYLTVRLTIPAAEGDFSRDATGTEELKQETWDKELQTFHKKELSYGDPSSNAESMALRRAAAKFGLALYLYKKEK